MTLFAKSAILHQLYPRDMCIGIIICCLYKSSHHVQLRTFYAPQSILMIFDFIVAHHYRAGISIIEGQDHNLISTVHTLSKYTSHHVQLRTFECLKGY
jgi:hypothetical protein